MKVAAIAMTLSLCAFLVHLMIWRVHIPKRQTAALLTIFSVVLVVGLTFASSEFLSQSGRSLNHPWEFIHVGIFYTAVMLGYVVAYSAIEEKSPTMSIVSWVAEAGDRGRTMEEVERRLMDSSPINSRLQAMLRDRMIERRSQAYVIAAKGRLWSAVFASWVRLMNTERGG